MIPTAEIQTRLPVSGGGPGGGGNNEPEQKPEPAE